MPDFKITCAKFWVVIVLTLTLGACANLKEIKEFAAISADSASYQGIAKDYVASIERQKAFEDQKSQPELDAILNARKAQLIDILDLQQTISTYMQALGDLASDEPINYDNSIQSFTNALSNSKLLDQKDVTAVEEIGGLLLKAVTDGYRQRELRKLINDTNTPLQIVIKATQKILKAFAKSLEIEKGSIERYYDNLIFRPGSPSEPVAVALAKAKEADTISVVDQKIKAVNNYDSILLKIAQAHQHLYDNQDNIGKEQLAATIESYSKDIEKAYKALRDLNSVNK